MTAMLLRGCVGDGRLTGTCNKTNVSKHVGI